MVHVFGDSHSKMFRLIDGAVIHHTGTHTMYRIGRDGGPIELNHVQPDDICVWTYGEIDCRCHVTRIAELEGRDVPSVCEPLAQCYCAAMLNAPGAVKVIASVMPAGVDETEYLPMHGTLKERVAATRILNGYLRDQCRRAGIRFLDFHHAFAAPDGSLDCWRSDGKVHAADKCFWRVDAAFRCLMQRVNAEQHREYEGAD